MEKVEYIGCSVVLSPGGEPGTGADLRGGEDAVLKGTFSEQDLF